MHSNMNYLSILKPHKSFVNKALSQVKSTQDYKVRFIKGNEKINSIGVNFILFLCKNMRRNKMLQNNKSLFT